MNATYNKSLNYDDSDGGDKSTLGKSLKYITLYICNIL